MKRALILVDIQNDFCTGGALAVPGGDDVVPVANTLVDRGSFDHIICTQDWHPIDHQSFATFHGLEPYTVIDLHGLQQVLWPPHCVQGTLGARFHKELRHGWPITAFPKGRDPKVDSYSGFQDNGGRGDTGLHKYLSARHVTDVYVMGLATDYCVKFTALDAVRLGYNTTLVSDGCRGVNVHPDDSFKAIAEMVEAGVVLMSSASILGA